MGWNLLALAAATAVFPALLPVVGLKLWVAAYVVLVATLSSWMTARAVKEAGCAAR